MIWTVSPAGVFTRSHLALFQCIKSVTGGPAWLPRVDGGLSNQEVSRRNPTHEVSSLSLYLSLSLSSLLSLLSLLSFFSLLSLSSFYSLSFSFLSLLGYGKSAISCCRSFPPACFFFIPLFMMNAQAPWCIKYFVDASQQRLKGPFFAFFFFRLFLPLPSILFSALRRD